MEHEKFVENLLRRFEEIQKLVELRQKLIVHYGHEKQKQDYLTERAQKEKDFVR